MDRPLDAPLTRADIDGAVAAIRADMAAQIAAAVQAIATATAANLTDLRNEIVERSERLDRRTERIEINVNAILAQTAGMSKSLTAGEQFDSATAGTLAGIKRTIDALVRRIDGLEKAS